MDQLVFVSLGAAIALGLTIAVLVVFRSLGGRNEAHARAHSGYFIECRFREGFLSKILYGLAMFSLVLGVLGLLVAFARPTGSFVITEKEVISSERIDLIDVSGSMCFSYLNTPRSEGEVAREAHLDFLKLRSGKKDRAALWLFSEHPYKVQDFVADDYLYEFMIYSAPLVISSKANPLFFSSYAVCENHSIRFIDGEGGTELTLALAAIADYFRDFGNPRMKRKSVVIVTDAAVTNIPDAELKKLQEMDIKAYLLYIHPNKDAFGETNCPLCGRQFANSEKLPAIIASYGGEYYEAKNVEDLNKAYGKINRAQEAETRIKVVVHNEELFQKFVMFALAAFATALFLGFIHELIWGKRI